MWIVAKFSPYVWRESFCPECSTSCECSNYDNILEQDYDFECIENYSITSSETCSCDEDSLSWSENDFNIGNSFWFGIGSLLQQDSDLNMKVK